MARRIPPEDVVAQAIDDCLARVPRMRSQRELLDAVSSELARIDPDYRVGPERLRRIGIEKGVLTLCISYAADGREVGADCPVCGFPLEPVRNRTLDGDTVEMGRGCGRCGYSAMGEAARPARYEIVRKAAADPAERAAMLRHAQMLLVRAADLMDGALRMSGLEARSGDDSKTVRRIAADPSYGGSLKNLALDVERIGDDPLWTRPLDSPKGGSGGDRCNLFLSSWRWRPMKVWEYSKVSGSSIKIDSWMSETMGLVDGGVVYSTLFRHPDEGPKDHEIILSMFPQENYRTLTHLTIYMDDVPGSSAQAAGFLADRGINILNSVSLDGISDTTIVWKIMADMNFAGEGDLLREEFEGLKARDDPSVSKMRIIEVAPAEIGRLFKGSHTDGGKEEVRRGYPTVIKGGAFDVADQYGDVLGDVDGQNVLVTLDADSWVLSITFFKQGTRLVRVGIEMPDCPGGIRQALDVIAGWNVNLISVFSKVKVCYQTMYLELMMDIGGSGLSPEDIAKRLPEDVGVLNGVYTVMEIAELE